MTKGGTTKALRNLFIWCLIITIIILINLNRYNQIKYNYTELHRRVTDIERRIKNLP